MLARSGSWKAVGGRLKAGAAMLPSLPRMSLDEPGVGGGLGRGMRAVVLAVLEVGATSDSGRRAKKRWSMYEDRMGNGEGRGDRCGTDEVKARVCWCDLTNDSRSALDG